MQRTCKTCTKHASNMRNMQLLFSLFFKDLAEHAKIFPSLTPLSLYIYIFLFMMHDA